MINCPPHHLPARPAQRGRLRATALTLALLAVPALPMAAPEAEAGTPLSEALRAEVQRMARDAAAVVWAGQTPAPRTEVIVGALNPRLQLAPCALVVPYLPAGVRPLGKSRIGLRCEQGSHRWNVTLPVTIRVWAPSLVATTTLPAGTVLSADHLGTAEVDLAARSDPAISLQRLALGRTLARNLSAGDALRNDDLKVRQYFKAGDSVRIVAVGTGYAISSEGQALGPGLEGQPTRVRTDSGRVLTGIATAERRVEVLL